MGCFLGRSACRSFRRHPKQCCPKSRFIGWCAISQSSHTEERCCYFIPGLCRPGCLVFPIDQGHQVELSAQYLYTQVTKLVIFQSVLLPMIVSNFHTIIGIHGPWVFLPNWQCPQNIPSFFLQGLLALGSPWLRKLSIYSSDTQYNGSSLCLELAFNNTIAF